MKILIAIMVFTFIPFTVYAEVTATNIQIGTTSTSCTNGQSSCWVPISTSAPLPATLVIHQ